MKRKHRLLAFKSAFVVVVVVEAVVEALDAFEVIDLENYLSFVDRSGVIDPSASGAIWATTLMVLYYLFTRLVSGRSISHSDEFTDSLYYMGFLFTLIALLFTLLGIKDQAINAGLIIEQNGLALSTTIVGLTARFCLRQFHDEDYHNPFARINPEIDNLKTHIDGCVMSLSDLKTSLVECPPEIEHFSTAMANIEVEPGMVSRKIDSAFEGTGERLQRFEGGLGQLEASVRAVSEAVNSATEKFHQAQAESVKEQENSENSNSKERDKVVKKDKGKALSDFMEFIKYFVRWPEKLEEGEA